MISFLASPASELPGLQTHLSPQAGRLVEAEPLKSHGIEQAIARIGGGEDSLGGRALNSQPSHLHDVVANVHHQFWLTYLFLIMFSIILLI